MPTHHYSTYLRRSPNGGLRHTADRQCATASPLSILWIPGGRLFSAANRRYLWRPPRNHRAPYAVKEVIFRILDAGDYTQFEPDYAPEMLCANARLCGHPAAIIACGRQSGHRAIKRLHGSFAAASRRVSRLGPRARRSRAEPVPCGFLRREGGCHDL